VTGSGALARNPAGTAGCGAGCTSHPLGTTVTLTPVPAPGGMLVQWTGTCSGVPADSACVLTLMASTTAGAEFLTLPALTVVPSGEGSGTVTSAPAGINCGSSCSAPFAGSVTLTAVAAADSVFLRWDGCDSVSGSQCTVALGGGARTVFATFDPAPRTLTVRKWGIGNGSVTSGPADIDCGVTCHQDVGVVPDDTVVELTATPEAGSVFSGWGVGSCNSVATNPDRCTVTMSASRTVVATFTRTFTDATITAGVTVIRAVHVTELRSAIDTLRLRTTGLGVFNWTDPVLVAGLTQARAVHLLEMRTALNQVAQAQTGAGLSFTDATITGGVTQIRAVHFTQLRTHVGTLETTCRLNVCPLD
jgi:hypothetical protein